MAVSIDMAVGFCLEAVEEALAHAFVHGVCRTGKKAAPKPVFVMLDGLWNDKFRLGPATIGAGLVGSVPLTPCPRAPA